MRREVAHPDLLDHRADGAPFDQPASAVKDPCVGDHEVLGGTVLGPKRRLIAAGGQRPRWIRSLETFR